MSLIECVPNISEGRRRDVVAACADAVRTVASLLDVTSDSSHNRSVLTFAGARDAVRNAALALFEVALRTIDLRQHRGEHPRVGAIDVVPFVPLTDASIETCVDLAREVGEAVGRRFELPVYLYEHASRPGAFRPLEAIRRGGLAGLAARMAHPDWRPDFGPPLPHPTAGVTVIGARGLLVAYNVELGTDRLDIAKDIARTLRQSSGGLPALKAIGVPLADRGIVQVSMNLIDFRTTSIPRAFDAVENEATRRGITVIASELVGLAPQAALTPAIAAHVKLRDFDEDRMILERRLASTKTPGGPFDL